MIDIAFMQAMLGECAPRAQAAAGGAIMPGDVPTPCWVCVRARHQLGLRRYHLMLTRRATRLGVTVRVA